MEKVRRHPGRSEDLCTVFFCIVFCLGLMIAVGAMFWYWNQNDFVPNAPSGNPIEAKPPGN